MDIVPTARPDAPVLVLAHGAGAGSAHPWMRGVARGMAERGISVVTFDFPYIREKRRVPDRGPVLEEAFGVAWAEALTVANDGGRTPSAYFAGGKSMGGRIASQVAAKHGLVPEPRGLVFFGYPLHP